MVSDDGGATRAVAVEGSGEGLAGAGACGCCFGRLRFGLRFLRRLLARAVAVLIAARTFCSPPSVPSVVVDPGYRNRSTVRIDANGAPAVFECVLSLCGGARQQQCGDCKQLFHIDLLDRQNLKSRPCTSAVFQNVTYITLKA